MITPFDIRLPDPRPQVAHARPLLIVSADAHAGLPAPEYVGYLDPPYREAAQQWLQDVELHHVVCTKSGYPFPPEALEVIDTRHALRNGGELGSFDPERRLREAEQDGVSAEFLHPFGNIGSTPFYDVFSSRYSGELRAAGARAHNRFLVDFCSEAPERLLGVHLTYPWPDVQAAVEQCERARQAGARAVVPAQQAGVDGDDCPAFYDPFWDPFWAACQDLGLAVHVHAGFGKAQGMLAERIRMALAKAEAAQADGDDLSSALAEAFDTFPERRPLWQLMFGGVFDRFPRLKVVFAEIHGDWVPPTLAYLDSIADQYRDLMKLSPREYWDRHCAVGASLMRKTDVDARHGVGTDRMFFGTDFPHMEGSWPNTVEWLRATMADVPEDEARKIMGENAVEFYDLDRPLLEKTARRVGPWPGLVFEGDVEPAMLDHFHTRGGIGKQHVSVYSDELATAVRADGAGARSLVGAR